MDVFTRPSRLTLVRPNKGKRAIELFKIKCTALRGVQYDFGIVLIMSFLLDNLGFLDFRRSHKIL